MQKQVFLLFAALYLLASRPYYRAAVVVVVTSPADGLSIEGRCCEQRFVNDQRPPHVDADSTWLRSSSGDADANSIASSSSIRQELATLGVEQYDVFRNLRSRVGSNDDVLPMVMLVHHREFHAGCHSLERFLSTRWETIFVVGEDMAEEFQLRHMAQNIASLGVHLALLNSTMTGEWLGRQVALRILKNKPNLRLPLILSTHCDIHPLPDWHLQHAPFEQIVSRMVKEFLEEDKLGHTKQSNVMEHNPLWEAAPLDEQVCRKAFSHVHRPLLVMNTAMVETLPSSIDLSASVFHSYQVGLKRTWERSFARPQGLDQEKPWMSDVSTWVEDHFALYNATLLSEIVDQFALVHPTVSSGVKAIPQILCRRGWKAVRLNDSPMYIDLAKAQHTSTGFNGANRHLFNASKYGSVSLDWLFTRSAVNLAIVNSPMGCLSEYMRLRVFGGLDVSTSCVFAQSHFQPNHVPSTVWKNKIRDSEPIVNALMQIHGFEMARRTDDAITFVSIPAPSALSFGPFGKRLGSKVSGSSTDMFPEGGTILEIGSPLETITLNRNGRVSPTFFFIDYALRHKQFKPKQRDYFNLYQKSATSTCQWFTNSSSSSSSERSPNSISNVNDEGPMTLDEVMRAMQPLVTICGAFLSSRGL